MTPKEFKEALHLDDDEYEIILAMVRPYYPNGKWGNVVSVIDKELKCITSESTQGKQEASQSSGIKYSIYTQPQ